MLTSVGSLAVGPTFLNPSVLGQTLNTTIYSDPSKDGWVDTFVCSSGDDINALSSLRVGQGSVSVTSNYRSFVSFDVSSLKGVGITSATLFVYQSSVVDSPYTNGGNIVVDLVDYGPTLDVQDWCESATASDIGAISSNATLGFKSLNVTSSLASVLGQGNDLLQFRFQSQDENSSHFPAMLSLRLARLNRAVWLLVLRLLILLPIADPW